VATSGAVSEVGRGGRVDRQGGRIAGRVAGRPDTHRWRDRAHLDTWRWCAACWAKARVPSAAIYEGDPSLASRFRRNRFRRADRLDRATRFQSSDRHERWRRFNPPLATSPETISMCGRPRWLEPVPTDVGSATLFGAGSNRCAEGHVGWNRFQSMCGRPRWLEPVPIDVRSATLVGTGSNRRFLERSTQRLGCRGGRQRTESASIIRAVDKRFAAASLELVPANAAGRAPRTGHAPPRRPRPPRGRRRRKQRRATRQGRPPDVSPRPRRYGVQTTMLATAPEPGR
jgi:hypothetical protein